MKIIKQFEHPEFFKRSYKHHKGTWIWGLGDDGRLYYKKYTTFTPLTFKDEWCHYPNYSTSPVRFEDMIIIVKKFGHLLTFI